MSQLAQLPQSVCAKRCPSKPRARLLARFASQSHKRFAPTWRSPCPGKFAPRPLSPSLHPPSPLLLLPSLSSEALVLVSVLGVLLESTECQRCWLSLEIYF